MENLIFNHYVIDNLSNVLTWCVIAFFLSLILTPWIGKLAILLKIYDLPKSMREESKRGYETKIHDKPYARLGGMATFMTLSLVTILVIKNGLIPSELLNSAQFVFLVLGLIIIVILGFLDDKYELGSTTQLLFQIAASICVVLSGLSITSINIFEKTIDLSFLSFQINILGTSVNIYALGSLITILWVVGLINVVNWVGGVDALNGTVSSIAFGALIILTLSTGQIALAMIVAIYLGSLLGVLPYNYNPGKIMYGSIGDFMNGYLLAVFSILGSTRWSITIIILALPILDGIYVLYRRLKDNPHLRKSPLKVLSLSGKDHLHHRLMSIGFTQKTVVLFEAGLMLLVTSLVIIFTDIRLEYVGFIFSISIFLMFASGVFLIKNLKEKREKVKEIKKKISDLENDSNFEPIVKMEFRKSNEENDKDEDKFIY